MTPERGISLTQPWCGFVAAGIKRVENRPRAVIPVKMFHRPIALHATREIDEDVYRRVQVLRPDLFVGWLVDDETSWPAWYRLTRITSAIIGVVEVVARLTKQRIPGPPVYRDAATGALFDDEDQQRWLALDLAYVLAGARALGRPVPCRGWQGLWHLTSEEERQRGERSAVEREVIAQLSDGGT